MSTTQSAQASASTTPIRSTALTVRPFANGFGAQIDGVDLRQELSDEVFERIHQAFIDHHVLVFRSQALDDHQQLSFAQRFGPLEGHINRSTRHQQLPKVQIFSNVGADGRTTGAVPDKGTLDWHTDKSYVVEPSLTTILRSPTIARQGGDTLFADMHRAFEALSPEMQTRIANLRAVHDWKRSREKSKERPATAEEIAEAPPVEHPLVRTHPVTGRKGLYLGNHVSHIIGLPRDESDSLLKELEAHATQPVFVYRHKWQVDDVLMWDNRCTLHCVEPYDASVETRAVHRVVVRGDRPY
ncbi:MAG: TauD/TfdA family dioxygenase [Gammaproteobacteria bacterium]|nr:TauD/TfdA family dioxygenase [Gammaproteobacteria bacterium]